jgi:hypothetical protein
LKLGEEASLLLLLLLPVPGVLLNIQPMPAAALTAPPLAVGVPHTLPAAAAAAAAPGVEASIIFSSSSFSQLCHTASMALSMPTVIAGCTATKPAPADAAAAGAGAIELAPRADDSLLLLPPPPLLLLLLLLFALAAPAALLAVAHPTTDPAGARKVPELLPVSAAGRLTLLDTMRLFLPSLPLLLPGMPSRVLLLSLDILPAALNLLASRLIGVCCCSSFLS